MAYIQGYSTYNGYDMLNSQEIRDMRETYKEFKNQKHYKVLPGANTRALYKVIENTGVKMVVLKSYYTNVLVIDLNNNTVIKLWDGFSVTTLKHVNLLLEMFSFKKLSKKEFMNLKEDEPIKGLKL